MEEVVVLDSVLHTMRGAKGNLIGNLNCSIEDNEMLIKYGNCKNTYCKSSFVRRGEALDRKYSLESYLDKHSGKIILLREGKNIKTNKVVSVHLKVLEINTDTLIRELTEDCNSYSHLVDLGNKRVDTFVYNLHRSSAEIYPLKINTDTHEIETVVFKIKSGILDISKLSSKCPNLNSEFITDTLRLLWGIVGNFSFTVRLLKVNEGFFPLIYLIDFRN